MQLAKDLAKKAMSEGSGKAGAKLKDEVAAADRDALRKRCRRGSAKKKARDYVAVQAYINPSADNTAKSLQSICAALQERLGAATTLGFGPRFLHSTGQLHKGGPNSVLVLQIVDQPRPI